MQFGTLYAYWNKEGVCDAAGYAALIARAKSIGFDILEVSAQHVYEMSEAELAQLNALSKQHGILFTTNSGPAKEYDLASVDETVRQNGIRYFEVVLEKMTILGSKSLAGAIYSYWPCSFDDTDKEGAWARSIASLKVVAETAERLGITIALEVLNRNESYILNTCEEAMEYCDKVDSKAIKILLDTYHMNIEEDDPVAAIRLAGPRLAHFHVGEANRKLPGMNNTIDWKEIGAALHEIGYEGTVVMEPFLQAGGAVSHSIRLWRDLSHQADEAQMDRYITDSLHFLKGAFAKAA